MTDGEVTTVWRKVAAAGDAGSAVKLTSGTTMKVAVTLAAYRGTDTTNPVASITGAGEPGSTATHTSPSVANGTDGAWRVSYWSDKNSATTTLDHTGHRGQAGIDVRHRRGTRQRPADGLGRGADGRHSGEHGWPGREGRLHGGHRDDVDDPAQAQALRRRTSPIRWTELG